MTNNTKTNKYRIPADQLQNLEIDRNGRVTPRLHDLDPLQNTLLSVLYPGIKVASVNVPAEPLDDYEESQVENALARLVWNGVPACDRLGSRSARELRQARRRLEHKMGRGQRRQRISHLIVREQIGRRAW